MTAKSKNKLTPIEKLRAEKRVAKVECLEQEEKLLEKWDMLSSNIGPLLIDSATNTVLRRFGFAPSKKSSKPKSADEDGEYESNGFTPSLSKRLMKGAMSAFPMLWDIAQPFIWDVAVDKVKSLFSRKKKRKYYLEDDDEYEYVRKKKKKRKK